MALPSCLSGGEPVCGTVVQLSEAGYPKSSIHSSPVARISPFLSQRCNLTHRKGSESGNLSSSLRSSRWLLSWFGPQHSHFPILLFLYLHPGKSQWEHANFLLYFIEGTQENLTVSDFQSGSNQERDLNWQLFEQRKFNMKNFFFLEFLTLLGD